MRAQTLAVSTAAASAASEGTHSEGTGAPPLTPSAVAAGDWLPIEGWVFDGPHCMQLMIWKKPQGDPSQSPPDRRIVKKAKAKAKAKVGQTANAMRAKKTAAAKAKGKAQEKGSKQ